MERVLPDQGEVSLLRRPNGEIYIYGEEPEKRHPVVLKAVVLPDGQVIERDQRRFRRLQRVA